jgi:hypothetical protein
LFCWKMGLVQVEIRGITKRQPPSGSTSIPCWADHQTSDSAVSCGGIRHRFGSSLKPHVHYHLCVVDGLFENRGGDVGQDPTNPAIRLRSHLATALTAQLLERLQQTLRKRILRRPRFAGCPRRHVLLEPHQAEDMLRWGHGRGLSLFERPATAPASSPDVNRLWRGPEKKGVDYGVPKPRTC